MIRESIAAITICTASFSYAQIHGVNNLICAEWIELADEQESITALYIISSLEDYIGQGKSFAYDELDGKFSVAHVGQNAIYITFLNDEDWWHIDLTGPNNEKLMSGIYKNSQRFQSNERPGLDFYGCGRRCNTSSGEFGILEIEYGDEDQIVSFAANFIQKCEETGPPLFGTVRYNSSFPIEKRFADAFAPNASILVMKYNEHFYDSLLISSDESTFNIRPLPYGGNGVDIEIRQKDNGLWLLEFASLFDKELSEGRDHSTCSNPLHSIYNAGIVTLTSEGSISQPRADFKILELVEDENGSIKSLALDFRILNEGGDRMFGCVRFKSKIPQSNLRSFMSSF